jgi:hypothetical protein
MKISNLVLMFALFAQSLIPFPARHPAEAVAEAESIFQPAETPTPTAPPVETPTPTPTAPPVETPTETPAPAISILLTAKPDYAKPGGQVNIFWEVAGIEKFEEDAFLRFYAPSGFTPADEGAAKLDAQNGTYDVPIDSPNGKLQWNLAADISLPLYLAAELWQGGEALAQGEIELSAKNETIIDERGGEAIGLEGRVRVKFPEGAVAEKVKVKIENPSEKAMPPRSLSGSPFEITAYSESTQVEVSEFSKPIEIQVRYDETAMSGDEEDIRLFWYNPESGEWELPFSQSVDTENNLVIASTDHLTVFDTYNSGWQSAETPTLDFFQHSGFTGAAAFSMPIKVPPGPGGFQPSLALSYSSQVVDTATTDSQASWVGMGWSLDAGGYIERNGFGTAVTDDDTYMLNANGMSGTLWIGADGRYHLEDENFAKITFDSGADTWTILGKDGTQ